MQFLILLVLLPIALLDLFTHFVLFIQDGVLCIDDVHLDHGACCVLLCLDYIYLASMVLYFRDHINEDGFQTFKLPPECHVVLVGQSRYTLLVIWRLHGG